MKDSDIQPLTILIVEDVDWIRAGMKKEVEGQGFRVVEARDDQEALAVAQRKPVALILTEEDLPTFNALMDRRREHSSLGNPPVAIVNPAAEEGARFGDAYLLPNYATICSFLESHGD
jgi:CheY-like chemotaxis protein